MTNDEGMMKQNAQTVSLFVIWSFGFNSSFVIRISSFSSVALTEVQGPEPAATTTPVV
jgi:hypothetical protein